MRLAEEVARTKKPRKLVRDSKPVAMLMPMAAAKKARNTIPIFLLQQAA